MRADVVGATPIHLVCAHDKGICIMEGKPKYTDKQVAVCWLLFAILLRCCCGFLLSASPRFVYFVLCFCSVQKR